MKPISVLILEDEEPALRRVKTLVESDKDFTVSVTCTSGTEALSILSKHPVDLLLLDIEMPGINGLDLLDKLADKIKPLVVFVTAYDEYAVQAFEYYAIDYVLKPYSNERFEKMLSRVKERFVQQEKNDIKWNTVKNSIEQGKISDRLTIKTGKKYYFIAPAEISYICANGNYCEIHLIDGTKHLYRATLNHIISVLPSDSFIRIHYSSIVSITSVAEVKRLAFGEMMVKMKNNSWLKISRKHRTNLKKIFNL